jgi:putative phosphoribosyl transferase
VVQVESGVYFANRLDAGQLLGALLSRFRAEDPVVVGIPPGGMPVAARVARMLDAPLDMIGLAGYVGRRRRPAVAGRSVVLVDDQLAGDRVARDAARLLRHRGATRVILAVPVAAAGPAQTARRWVDELVCVAVRAGEGSLERCYADFADTSSAEVAALLAG